MQIGPFSLCVLTEGRPLREYGFDNRTFVAGSPSQQYTVRLVSRASSRAKVVLSVDGVNAIDGKPAGLGGPGYVLEPWSAMDVPGWRISDEAVARFLFGTPEQSYAAVTGKAENVGVIGAAFFDEVPIKPTPTTVGLAGGVMRSAKGGPKLTAGTGVSASGSSGNLGGSLGTGFGVRADHSVRRVDFNARPNPACTIQVRYEDAAILRGLGVEVEDEMPALHNPTPFPAEGYCAPPSGWRG